MREIKKISYSFLHTLACPYAAFLRYEAQIKAPETEYMAFGSALHLALEEQHRDKKTFDLSEAIKIFLKDFRTRIEENEIFIQWAKIKKMEADGTTILEKYAHDFGLNKFPAPSHVEREFSIPFEDIEIVGKIDAEEIDDEGHLTSIDYKSASRKPDPWFLRHNPQFTAYAWAAKELHGKLPDKIIWHHLRTGERLETIRTETDIDDLKTMIHNALVMNRNEIRHRVFHDAVCDWCEYSGTRGRLNSICDDRELERRILDEITVTEGIPVPENS